MTQRIWNIEVMDGWYYKVFDSEFGPVTFDELVFLAKTRSLSRSDEVRFGTNAGWRQAGSIGPLMTHFPFEAVEKVITASAANPSPTAVQPSAANQPAVETQGTDSWEIDEQDMVPSMDDFAIAESSVATKWMRYGSNQEVAVQETSPAKRSPVVEKPVRPAPAPAPSQNRKNDRDDKDDEPPVTDARWWCMIKEKEYGPVELPKLIDWAATGRLHRDDFVRFGLQPYVRADELPELFPKLPPQQAQDTKTDIESKTEIRTSSAPKFTPRSVDVVQPSPASAPMEAPVASRPEPQPMPMPTAPSNSFSGGGFQGGGSFASARPAAAAFRKIPTKSSSSGEGIGKLLMSPAVLGGVGVVLLCVLGYFALPFLPFMQSADVGRLKELKEAYDNITKVRSGKEVKSSDAKGAASKAESVAKKIAGDLKGTKDKNSKKVLDAATKLEKASKCDLSKPSDSEKEANEALNAVKSAINSAKNALKVKL